ncbi:hypothetical protein HDU97_005873, partial [Phlyctochytrium planicorne]
MLIVIAHLDACLFWFTEMILVSKPRWIDTNSLLYFPVDIISESASIDGSGNWTNPESDTNLFPSYSYIKVVAALGWDGTTIDDAFDDTGLDRVPFSTQYLTSYLASMKCVQLKLRK